MSDYSGTSRSMYAISGAAGGRSCPQGGRAGTIRSEIAADELLRRSTEERGRGQYPFYTQRRMEELSSREQEWRDELEPMPGPGEALDEGAGTLARAVVDAQLTRRQRMVIRWLAQGLSQRRIAEMLGVSEASVTRLKQSAFEEMRRAAQRR